MPDWTVPSADMGRKRKPVRRMEKTIYTPEYEVVLGLLRDARERAGLSQVELAAKLGQSQSFVSKAERGERRLDVIQLRTILRTLGMRLTEFVTRLEAALGEDV